MKKVKKISLRVILGSHHPLTLLQLYWHKSKTLSIEDIKSYFMQELLIVLQNKDEIIKNLQATVKLLNTNKLIEKRNILIEKREKLIEKINNSVYESAGL